MGDVGLIIQSMHTVQNSPRHTNVHHYHNNLGCAKLVFNVPVSVSMDFRYMYQGIYIYRVLCAILTFKMASVADINGTSGIAG